MATIQQQIEVAAEPALVSSNWGRFIQWARTGPGHLVCNEVACVDAVRSGLVDFVPAAGGAQTTVVFRMEAPADAPSPDELQRRLRPDLVVFKDYIDAADWFVARSPRPTGPRSISSPAARATSRATRA